jgi:putative ABC transport system permease protein
MTLGFIISGVICFLGFLLYWGLSFNSRKLQFGIFRAMGLSKPRLIIVIIWEQILTSGAAVLLGIGLGIITSNLFVPLFQTSKSAASQVPPFHVLLQVKDRLKIYYLLAAAVFLAFIGLSYLLKKLEINKAIKLGED